jgi:hypothetical protein
MPGSAGQSSRLYMNCNITESRVNLAIKFGFIGCGSKIIGFILLARSKKLRSEIERSIHVE